MQQPIQLVLNYKSCHSHILAQLYIYIYIYKLNLLSYVICKLPLCYNYMVRSMDDELYVIVGMDQVRTPDSSIKIHNFVSHNQWSYS